MPGYRKTHTIILCSTLYEIFCRNIGSVFRRSFAGQDKNGVVIRLNGDQGDEFQVIVQDNLTGLTHFRTVVQGHVVED